jgi:hypothetical protein
VTHITVLVAVVAVADLSVLRSLIIESCVIGARCSAYLWGDEIPEKSDR